MPNKAAAKLQEIFPKLTPANLSKLLDSKYETERDRGLNEAAAEGQDTLNPSGISLRPGRIEYVSSFRAQAGKRIAIPVRVEPKVFYANERTSEFRASMLLFSRLTFSSTALSWVEFSVVVSAIGIGILSYADPHGTFRFFLSRRARADSSRFLQMTSPSPRLPPSPPSLLCRYSTPDTHTSGVSRGSGSCFSLPPLVDLIADPASITGIARPSTTTTGSAPVSSAVSCFSQSSSTSR